VDFRLGEKSEAFRDEVRRFVAEHLPAETIERVHQTGTAHDWDFYRALGAQGWIAASWPADYGGQGRDPFEMTALRDELRLAFAPTDGMGQSMIVARTIDHVGTEYAKSRHQFGVPIGSFQSIARDLADVATAVDGARLLAREAAWAASESPDELPALAGMAFLFAARTAQRTASVALHVHGGYGFMLEYDIQLYYRRAKAWPLVLGDPRRVVRQLADALFGPVEGQ
jgi:alkylation response protein AidB-like acyl-CoA dehydrogenase